MTAMTARVVRGKLAAELLRRGWRPPPLNNTQAQRLLDDITAVDKWGQTLKLTSQEARVLALMASGKTADGTAAHLGVSLETVKGHVVVARNKLGARNITHAVAIAIDEGIIGSPSGWKDAA
jgi:DNA-binding CsgD family transcriptional regulator